MSRRVATLLLSIAIALTPLGLSPASAAVVPQIQQSQAFDAPVGGKGGIMSPYVSCSNYRIEPRVRWTVTRLATGRSRTYRWTGALPGMHFPRVAVGRYRVRTVATCRGTSARKVDTVRVREKTYNGTVSRSEFRRVTRGMTRAQVAEIIGNDGRDPFRYNGVTTRTYDMMAFWSWSIIRYRDGRVVDKFWDVGHD